MIKSLLMLVSFQGSMPWAGVQERLVSLGYPVDVTDRDEAPRADLRRG